MQTKIGAKVFDGNVKTVRGVLDRAIRVLKMNGLVQGAEFKQDLVRGTLGFCSTGALHAAAGGKIPSSGSFENGVIQIDEIQGFNKELVDEALTVVAREINPDFDNDQESLSEWQRSVDAVDTVIEFNDAEGRTVNDVLKVFVAARAKA